MKRFLMENLIFCVLYKHLETELQRWELSKSSDAFLFDSFCTIINTTATKPIINNKWVFNQKGGTERRFKITS